MTDLEEARICLAIRRCEDLEELKTVTLGLVGSLSRTRDLLLKEMAKGLPVIPDQSFGLSGGSGSFSR